MFSRKLVRILCVILLALINIVLLSISAKHPYRYTLVDRVVMAGMVPFQESVTCTMRFCRRVWHHYFYLVGVREECEQLKRMLGKADMERSRHLESELACKRLGELLEVKYKVPHKLLPAQVAALDPSGWSKSIIINKGSKDGVTKRMAVIAPGGIVGHVIKGFDWSAQVLLAIDRGSAIDALVQRSRFRGIVEGETDEACRFNYVVRKADVKIGDTIVSSGLDGIFPKGLLVGTVSEISKPASGLFQEVKVRPFVDFTRLEEVLVVLE
jgi:rod shape-determining protein MreC